MVKKLVVLTIDKLGQVKQLVDWCLVAEIKILTVYEASGVLKTSLQDYSKPRTKMVTSGLYDGSACDLVVNLLSEEDGREAMVDLARTFVEMSQTGKLHPSSITQELLSKQISDPLGDPELLIIALNKFTLQGFPPWLLATTELL